MAKAKPKATTQILLKDALARVVAEVQVPHYAQRLCSMDCQRTASVGPEDLGRLLLAR